VQHWQLIFKHFVRNEHGGKLKKIRAMARKIFMKSWLQ
jgi:hypothetical protein